MAKLRDTAVKDNLNIAGSVVAGGKVLSVEGHTHTPANITGLDTYINQKIQAAGGSGTPASPSGDINAKTLDGHPASDFVLKTESTTTTGSGTIYSYKKTLKFTSPKMQITIPDSMEDAIIKVTDKFSTKTFKKSQTYNMYLATMELFDFPDRELYNYSAYIPIWCTNTNTIAISGLSHDELKITVEVLSITPITDDIKISTDITISGGRWGLFNIDRISLTRLGYSVYDSYRDIFIPPLGLRLINSTLTDYNTLYLYGDVKILDLDNNLTVRTYNGSLYSYNPNNVQYKSARVYNNGVAMYFINGLSKNIVVKSSNGIVYYDTNTYYISSNLVNPSKDVADRSDPEYNFTSMKKLISSSNNSGGSISATINGVQFDGKTNITTPASKLITPVHINGVEFDGSQDITIPAPTNALTLGGLDSSQYIKATDVGNAAGKIPKFDNEGFLVYPDGSKERIENA